ncbi:TetR/AcrR family transcriptional regulator [Streptomyces sp. NPDC001568]|uniref:TetR/AcrR family transcriptional regulator n=1 Tax=Streptomyces sp. NPDC001568 TaxID=3364588 RepID=UPI0036ADE80F
MEAVEAAADSPGRLPLLAPARGPHGPDPRPGRPRTPRRAPGPPPGRHLLAGRTRLHHGRAARGRDPALPDDTTLRARRARIGQEGVPAAARSRSTTTSAAAAPGRQAPTEAAVPLGATTYHFATREDLIAAALHRAVDRFATYLDTWTAQRPDLTPEQFAVLLTVALMTGFTTEGRGQNVMEFELYLAALRHPALRAIADRYTELTIRACSRYTDPVTAAAVDAATNGITLHGLAISHPPTRDEVEAILRRILTPNPNPNLHTAPTPPTRPDTPT